MRDNAGKMVLVVCPLEIEASAARAALRRAGLREGVRVVVSGPGIAAARGAVRMGLDACGGRASGAVLFGTCGSLHVGAERFGAAPEIGVVVDASGKRWAAASLHGGGGGDTAGVLACVESPLVTPADKRACHARTGADFVDCESAGFAAACEEAAIAWGVVRGVSDAWDETLPAEVARWVSERGGTMVARVAWDCVRSPSLVPRVMRLGRRSGAALRAAGDRLVTVVGGALEAHDGGEGRGGEE